MTDVKSKNCSKCKVNRTIDHFISKTKRELKSCSSCRANDTKYRNKNKCEHGQQKGKCKDCGGSQICEHKRLKYKCKDCGGSQICEHKRIKYGCKDCGGSSICIHKREKSYCKYCCKDPLRLTFKNMIKFSRKSDIKHDRYDANNHIDYCFLEILFEDTKHCYYDDCKVEMQYMERTDTMLTIERLDNSIGHTKANCVFCCLKCNNMKKSNRD